jgi:hypothetical protein
MDQPFGDCHAAKVRREAHRTAAEAAALPEKINFNAAPLSSASPKPNATWNARPPLFRRQSLNSFPALASNTVAAPVGFHSNSTTCCVVEVKRAFENAPKRVFA